MSLDSVPAAPAGRLEPTLVADLVALAAARDGDRDALVETSGRHLTWADLDSEVDRLATGPGRGRPLDDGRGESVVAQPVGERGAGDAGAGDQYGVHEYTVHQCTAWSSHLIVH